MRHIFLSRNNLSVFVITAMLAVLFSCEWQSSSQSTDGNSPSAEVYDFFKLTEKPRLIKQVQAVYPSEAREMGIEGRINLLVVIDENGRVIQAEAMAPKNKEADPLLAKAALDAVYEFEFTPGKVDGQAVRCKMAVPFDFKLTDTGKASDKG